MSQTIVARFSSLIAALTVTAGLLFGVTGIAHASSSIAGTAVATVSGPSVARA